MSRAFQGSIVIAAWLCATSLASADFRDGNDLLRRCGSPVEADLLLCFGYIEAITDVMLPGNVVNGFRACVASGVQADQLKDIVVQFLRLNPSRRHFGGAGLVARAISEAFPCR
jgi:hypothetical protein